MGFTFLSDILHVVAQALLAPDIVLLLAFMGYALFSIGSVITEYFTERKHFTVVMPKFLAALMDADMKDVPQIIESSQLLERQKTALKTVYEYRDLPGDALVALVRRLVSEEETRYDRITGRNNMAAKVTPMLGLMGTLIPLGPGIQALGNADTAALSSSLLVAFDTTVAGLVTAAVCLIVGKIRSNWYNNYLTALDASMATMLEKIEIEREAGRLTKTDRPRSDALGLSSEDLSAVSPFSNFVNKGQSGATEGAPEAPEASQPTETLPTVNQETQRSGATSISFAPAKDPLGDDVNSNR